MALRRGALAVDVCRSPLSIDVSRGGRPLLSGIRFWTAAGSVHDRLVQATEGAIAEERLEERVALATAVPVRSGADGVQLRGAGDGEFLLTVELHRERVVIDLQVGQDFGALRLGAAWSRAGAERLTGLGARHGLAFDQGGRRVRLGADRRYTGPDCPPELLEAGGIPQADCAPAPWLLSDRGYGLWLETYGRGAEFDLGSEEGGEWIGVSTRIAAGPFRLHVITDATPAARLRHYSRLTGYPALLPEWGYGHWKSRDVYEHQEDVVDDFEGYRCHSLPLDAIVIDSPWETHYNTWEFDREQFPDPEGLIRRMRSDGIRTVVWVTPWVNLESEDGQRPPGPGAERRARERAPNYEPARRAGHFVMARDGEPLEAKWWMGTGSPVDFTSPAADRWWRSLARGVLEMGVEGIKADDGDGWYLPPESRLADGRSAAEGAWAWGELYRASMQRALDDAAPGTGVLFGRGGWSGQQRLGILWGGDQASDFWSLRALVTATLTAAASGFSNWSHDVGGYLGRRLVERCPRELLVRWVQFGCFTPLMHAHGRFQQEAWTYDQETLDLYRRYVLLHERLVPYVRGAAATAARCGLPIVRPLCLTDPRDPRGWAIADAYGYGPALWVAPVLDEGVHERRASLPRGDWIDYWSGEHVEGGREVLAAAPLERIPVWVRSGSVVVTYPEDHVATGLGDVAERERPLEATLWGKPPLGRAGARLADGTIVRWTRGQWSVTPKRELQTSELTG